MISNSANGKPSSWVNAHLIDRDFGKSIVGDTAHKNLA
jgi:hypothetical protein